MNFKSAVYQIGVTTCLTLAIANGHAQQSSPTPGQAGAALPQSKITIQVVSVAYQSGIPELNTLDKHLIVHLENGNPIKGSCYEDLHFKHVGEFPIPFAVSGDCKIFQTRPVIDISSFVGSDAEYEYSGKINGQTISGKLCLAKNQSSPLDTVRQIQILPRDEHSVLLKWSRVIGAKMYEVWVCSEDMKSCGGYSNGWIEGNYIKLSSLSFTSDFNKGKLFRVSIRAYSFNPFKQNLALLRPQDLRASETYTMLLTATTLTIPKPNPENLVCLPGCTNKTQR